MAAETNHEPTSEDDAIDHGNDKTFSLPTCTWWCWTNHNSKCDLLVMPWNKPLGLLRLTLAPSPNQDFVGKRITSSQGKPISSSAWEFETASRIYSFSIPYVFHVYSVSATPHRRFDGVPSYTWRCGKRGCRSSRSVNTEGYGAIIRQLFDRWTRLPL